MIKVVIGVVAVALATCLGLPVLLAASVMGGTHGCGDTPPPSTSSSGRTVNATNWDAGQLAVAATIIEVGAAKKVPSWGWAIALAVAMQESGLRNLPHLGHRNDHDSIGVFQQRPSQGWGTIDQLSQPAYQAGKFFDKLLTIPGWQTMPLTHAAQAVQNSAYPNAYEAWTDDALRLVEEHNGSINPACSMITLADADPAPRNPDGSWPDENCTIKPDPTTGSGCLTPRTHHLVEQARAAGFPEPACYRPSDHGEHPTGRACDWMMTSGEEASGAQRTRGDAMAAWAVANADRLGIMYIIWFRMIWTRQQGWHAYNNPWGSDDPSGWHTNHVHISVE